MLRLVLVRGDNVTSFFYDDSLQATSFSEPWAILTIGSFYKISSPALYCGDDRTALESSRSLRLPAAYMIFDLIDVAYVQISM
jgi:hypothetical protein